MRLSNLVACPGHQYGVIQHAHVDVQTGIFRKKVQRKEIARIRDGWWFFVDTGLFTPDYQAEKLYSDWMNQYE